MLDFYQSPEFRTYRKRLLKALVEYCGPRMKNAKDPKDFYETTGAVDLARKILAIPEEDTLSDDFKRYAKEDIETFFAGLIRVNIDY